MPTRSPSDGLKIDRPAVPDLEDYRALLHGLKAIEVFVNEDHSKAEALTGRVLPTSSGSDSAMCGLTLR
jgi:hypothetical protein